MSPQGGTLSLTHLWCEYSMVALEEGSGVMVWRKGQQPEYIADWAWLLGMEIHIVRQKGNPQVGRDDPWQCNKAC